MKRAVSPIIGTLLLVLIVVGIGVALHAWAHGYFGTLSAVKEASLGEVHLVAVAGGKCLLTVTVENVGATRISSCSVAIGATTLGAPSWGSLSGIDGGKSKSAGWLWSWAPTPGQQYRVAVRVTFADGSTKVYSAVVTAESASG